MNTKFVISGLMAACMMASAPAFAQRGDYGHHRNDQVHRSNDQVHRSNDQVHRSNDQVHRGNDQYRQYEHRDRGHSERRDWNERGDRRGHNDGYNRHDGYRHNDGYRRGGHGQAHRGYDASRHDGYRHQMRRGGQLPHEYRGSRYVINDWHGRRLSAPPRGYHWVQANNDYVLAAIATGLIAQVLLNN